MADAWTDGARYEAYVGRWSRLVARAFLAWLGAPERLTWVDIGCGTGALTQAILAGAAPWHVIGVEPSDDYLAAARAGNRDGRAEFRRGAAQAVPVAPRSVDVAVSGLVLNFVPNPEAALADMRRILRPGATAALYVWDYAEGMQMMRRFWDAAVALDPAAAELDEGRRFPLCAPLPLQGLFAAAAFRDIVVAPLEVPTVFRDFDDYWTPFLGGQAPAPGYCVALDEARREALRERLRATLPAEPDGTIRLTARAWAVRGRVGG
jgi:SAM-dependent methyltransferase